MLYHRLRDRHVLDSLLKDARITETEGPKKKAQPVTKPKKRASPKKTTKTTKKKVGKRSS